MDETSIKHWIGQLDKHRDDLVIALHYYGVEKNVIPKNEDTIASIKAEVQHICNNIEFATRRLKEEVNR